VIRESAKLISYLRLVHAAIRDAVVAACERRAIEQLAAPVADEGGDTVFALDRVSESVLLDHFGKLANTWSFVLIAEGLGTSGQRVLPEGTSADAAELRIIVDPIDGTRGLMYQKRPGWVLTGVAPNRGASTTLADIELAVQTEIPLVKQHLSDSLWLADGQVTGERFNRLTGERQELVPAPSRARTIAYGYGGISRFFPPGRGILATADDAVVERLLGPLPAGRALTFEDQYISTGGQLYELMAGHDRWIGDLRPLLEEELRKLGRSLGLACHPYDLCTESIARACGVAVTTVAGEQLAAPLDVTTDVAWLGFANPAIRGQVLSVLPDILRELGLDSDISHRVSAR